MKVLEIYSGKKKDEIPFNILFSNTQTLLPANYSAVPRPVITRRHKGDDPIGKAAASAGEKCLSYLIDTNTEGYETFDECMKSAVLDALLPGRGVTTVKYDANVEELPTQSVDSDDPDSGEEKEPPAPDLYKKGELACGETRTWSRVYFGYAKKWSKVPWIAYEEDVDQTEATRLFGENIASKLTYAPQSRQEDDKQDSDRDKDEESKSQVKTCRIYQLWDKDGGKKIRYLAETYQDGFLREEGDPLGLTGFFNCPKPIAFIEKSNDLSPVAPYLLYENQATELNRLTVRINQLIKAIKARGIYDSALGQDIKNLMSADENELVPADKSASISAESGIDKSIWFMPVEKLITVLRELYAARESCKQVIFEIMGLADIMRGSSQASETLGAQEIKQAWGGLRLKSTQKEVQRYARDLLRMFLEIAATKFSESTWAQMTGLPYLTSEQVMELQQMGVAAQQALTLNPQDPAAVQEMQRIQQEMQKPQWSQVLDVLKNDVQRSYRVDIETNSTVEPEAVEDQKNIAEVMNALGQFLNGVTPLVTAGVMPFQAAQAMMLAIVRRFRFGDEIEDYILQMKEPKPPDEGQKQADAAKQQAELQKMQFEQQQAQVDAQARNEEQQLKLQVAREQAALEAQRMRLEAEAAREEHAMKMAEMAAKKELNEIITRSKIQVALTTAATKEREAAAAPKKVEA